MRANVESLSQEGRGVAHIDSKATFITGALPKEEVEFRYIKRRGSYDEGEVESIVIPSPHRVVPQCAYFGTCGGCSLQHLAPEAQINFKQNLLIEQLKHLGKVTPEEILPPLTAAHWGYRTKARLGVRYVRKKESVLVGFREKQGRYLADMNSCDVLHPNVGQLIEPLREFIATLETFEHIPQIEIAVGEDATALIFRHLKELPTGDVEKLIAFAKNHGIHLYLQPKGPTTIHLLWPEQGEERLRYTLPEFSLEYLFHPIDFTQVNVEINQKMVSLAIELLNLTKDDNVLDLFCGLGNFSLPIAKHCQKVIGIEGSDTMAERATMNAMHNNINNTEFYSLDLTTNWQEQPFAQNPYSKLVIDPPRAGALEIVNHIETIAPERIVYVSCNPATLARDAGILVNDKGYRLTKAGVMDMFPHTSHVESIAVFDKV